MLPVVSSAKCRDFVLDLHPSVCTIFVCNVVTGNGVVATLIRQFLGTSDVTNMLDVYVVARQKQIECESSPCSNKLEVHLSSTVLPVSFGISTSAVVFALDQFDGSSPFLAEHSS